MTGKAVLVRVTGRVTGVCFRFCTLDRGQSLPSLSGYVRNMGYGEVEVFVQGNADEVDAMVAWLSRGPPSARVDAVAVNEAALDPACKGFSIR